MEARLKPELDDGSEPLPALALVKDGLGKATASPDSGLPTSEVKTTESKSKEFVPPPPISASRVREAQRRMAPNRRS